MKLGIPTLLCLLWGALLCAPLPSHAIIIQILHTNDLHAAMKTAGAPKAGEVEYGGWAQVKAKMDALEKSAKALGIKTIRLDAGDFTEGSMEYFPDAGIHVLKTFQDMGYDATTVGNHDWLMGGKDMDALWGQSPFKLPQLQNQNKSSTQVLSANVEIQSLLPNLQSQIMPSTQIEICGIKIGIFGLSTNEALYSWIPHLNTYKNSFKLLPYNDEQFYDDSAPSGFSVVEGLANKTITRLRDQGSDAVIALTHIGYSSDILLASESKNLDLIIGGHSHTFLDSMNLVLDHDSNAVPIVQTGFNGQYIGKIWLEVIKGKKPRVLFYELIPVYHSDPSDKTITTDIEVAETALQKQYGNRLDEPLGTSPVRLISSDLGPTAFSKFAVDSMKDILGTDTAVDIGAFHGITAQPAGVITRRNLMEMYPRKFEADQNEGLYIYRTSVPGLLITLGLKYALKYGSYVAFSGITYDVVKMSALEFARLKRKVAGTADELSITPYYPQNIKLNGSPVKALQWYSMAAPETFVRGAFGLSPLVKIILKHAHPTSHTLWDAMNFKLLKDDKKISKITTDDIPNLSGLDIKKEKKKGAIAIQDPFDEGEGFVMPWINEFGTSETILNRYIQEAAKETQELPMEPLPDSSK